MDQFRAIRASGASTTPQIAVGVGGGDRIPGARRLATELIVGPLPLAAARRLRWSSMAALRQGSARARAGAHRVELGGRRLRSARARPARRPAAWPFYRAGSAERLQGACSADGKRIDRRREPACHAFRTDRGLPNQAHALSRARQRARATVLPGGSSWATMVGDDSADVIEEYVGAIPSASAGAPEPRGGRPSQRLHLSSGAGSSRPRGRRGAFARQLGGGSAVRAHCRLRGVLEHRVVARAAGRTDRAAPDGRRSGIARGGAPAQHLFSRRLYAEIGLRRALAACGGSSVEPRCAPPRPRARVCAVCRARRARRRRGHRDSVAGRAATWVTPRAAAARARAKAARHHARRVRGAEAARAPARGCVADRRPRTAPRPSALQHASSAADERPRGGRCAVAALGVAVAGGAEPGSPA
jgi:hypothetical protein